MQVLVVIVIYCSYYASTEDSRIFRECCDVTAKNVAVLSEVSLAIPQPRIIPKHLLSWASPPEPPLPSATTLLQLSSAMDFLRSKQAGIQHDFTGALAAPDLFVLDEVCISSSLS